MLLAALAETGCEAAGAVMVGDTEFDVAMGRAAGMATIGVAWGYHPRERLEAAGADVIIDELRRARRRPGPARGRRRVTWAPRRRFWQAAPRPARRRGGFARRARRPAAEDARPARRSSCRPRRWPRRSPPNGTRSTARSGPSACRSPAPPTRRSTGSRRSARRWSTRSPTTAAPTCSATAPPSPRRWRRGRPRAGTPGCSGSARALGAPLVAVDRRHAPAAAGRRASRRCAPRSPREDAFGLIALHELVALSGSLVLGLAVARGALDAAEAWELSRIDETWQAEQWGLDAEAEAAAAARRRADFLQARRAARRCSAAIRARRNATTCATDDRMRHRRRAMVSRPAAPLDLSASAHKTGAGADARCPRRNTIGAATAPTPLPLEAAQQEEEQ